VVGRDVGASNFRKFRTGRQDAGSTGRHELCRVGGRGGTIGFGVAGCVWLVGRVPEQGVVGLAVEWLRGGRVYGVGGVTY